MNQNYQYYGDTQPPYEPQYAPPKKSNTPMIIAIVVVVVILLCCCCIAFPVFMYYVGGDMLTDWLGITQLLPPSLI
jgi:hypothetical protein